MPIGAIVGAEHSALKTITEVVPGCRFASRCAYADAQCTASEPEFINNIACFHPVTGAVK